MLSTKFRKALVYAFDLHSGQIKKASGVPYVGHLLATAATVIEHGGDETQAIAALLHDSAEDHGGRKQLKKVEKKFGGAVAAIVEDCTDTLENPKPPWIERKRAFVRHVSHFPDEALIVIAADKLDNCRRTLASLRAKGKAAWKTVSGGRERLWYYRSVLSAMGPRLSRVAPGLHDELSRAVSDLERAAKTPKPRSRKRR